MQIQARRIYSTDDFYTEVAEDPKLTGEQIRGILIQHARSNNLLCRQERNIRGVNENPFDLVFGDEASLEMCAIEIKGDTDNFSRLSKQIEHYLYGFNNVYVAFHKKEAPDWLPSSVGILRVAAAGTVAVEMASYPRSPLDISTEYEWDQLFKANGLGTTHVKTREILNLLRDVRQNIVFNRFFAVPKPNGEKGFSKFYPLSDKQKSILMSYNIDYHFGNIKRDLSGLEKRLTLLKGLCKPYELEPDDQLELFKKGEQDE